MNPPFRFTDIPLKDRIWWFILLALDVALLAFLAWTWWMITTFSCELA